MASSSNHRRRLSRSRNRRNVSAIVFTIAIAFAGDPHPAHVRNFGAVSSSIYRGAQPSEAALEDLAGLHVKTVIDLREPGAGTELERAQAQRLGLKYVNLPMRPFSAPTPEEVRRALGLLGSQNCLPVFVHCRRGKDRTGTVIACYRIQHDGWTNRHALEEANRFGMSHAERAMRSFVIHFTALSPTVILP